jgi:hypothetical protein
LACLIRGGEYGKKCMRWKNSRKYIDFYCISIFSLDFDEISAECEQKKINL